MRRRAMVSTWRKVRGEQPGCLCSQEGSPARVCMAGGRTETRAGEDPPDRSGADPMPETEQLTLNSPVPPARILPG